MNSLLRRSLTIYTRHIPQSLRSPPRPRPTCTKTPSNITDATLREAAAQKSATAAADSMHQTPKLPKYLGYAGTIPFLSAAALSLTTSDPIPIATSVQMYGASILSFLGAVHWGVALRSPLLSTAAASLNRDFSISVLPSLFAWGAAMLPALEGLFSLSVGFTTMLLYDSYRFRAGQGVPAWYRRLRRPLSFAAIFGTVVTMRSVWRASQCPRNRAVMMPDAGAADAGVPHSHGAPDFVQVSVEKADM